MKTVEQAAKENADKKYPKIGLNEDWKDDGFDEGYDAAMHNKSIEEFKAGVEFAQRWIPIEEELPKNSSNLLLVKWIDKSNKIKYGLATCIDFYSTGLSKEKYLDFTIQGSCKRKVTHWRQIELL
jgi:hypothetical protein